MNTDLISREALKKAFEDTVCIEPMPYAFVKQIIDNAPTVEPERPQGEWIEKVETKQLGYGWLTTHEIVCSACGGSGENDENIPQCWKFCPNCGLKMI